MTIAVKEKTTPRRQAMGVVQEKEKVVKSFETNNTPEDGRSSRSRSSWLENLIVTTVIALPFVCLLYVMFVVNAG